MDARLSFVLLVFISTQAFAFDHAHQAWDALLRKHVVVLEGGKASRLDYAAMARERAALKGYLAELSKLTEAQFNGSSQAQQMAFLINAYNAYTVEKILTRYPNLKSIWDFGKFFGNPFRDRFFLLLGGPKSLDEVEHEILRKAYREPRIHFAVNCAAVGCPMLREEAYVGARLERQLDEQAARFLSDRSRNRVRAGRLEVSKIFDWFKEDFEPREAYFARYAGVLADNPRDRQRIGAAAVPVSFLEYDWSLNDSASSSPR